MYPRSYVYIALCFYSHNLGKYDSDRGLAKLPASQVRNVLRRPWKLHCFHLWWWCCWCRMTAVLQSVVDAEPRNFSFKWKSNLQRRCIVHTVLMEYEFVGFVRKGNGPETPLRTPCGIGIRMLLLLVLVDVYTFGLFRGRRSGGREDA